jgi:hypothetical protein
MMAFLAALRRARLLAVAATCAALIAVVFIWSRPARERPAEVVAAASASPAWQTVEYRGIRVDVPIDWRRSDMSGCEFQFEHWAPPGWPACGLGGGVAFYGSATFDPVRGPGVQRGSTNSAGPWSGYVYAGDYAVHVADPDRELVQRVLDSVRTTESRAPGGR